MKKILFGLTVLLFSTTVSFAQPSLQNDYSYSIEVPSVIGMESSAAHLYVLSDSEGMAVFRTHIDSLQWLYTAAEMQQRGYTLSSDIRFAYLFGDSRRLTVLEPTSVMGAYSATTLPQKPQHVVRVDNSLYIALGEDGLGKLNLESADKLDSEAEIITAGPLGDQQIIDLQSSSENIYALSSNQELFVFNKNQSDVSYSNTLSLDEDITRIFYINNSLLGITDQGDIYEISGNGSLSQLGSIDEKVLEIKSWDDWLIIRGESNRLWTSYQLTEPTLWKQNRDAGNYLATSKGNLWISEYNRISRVREDTSQSADQSFNNNDQPDETVKLEIEQIPDQIIPYPNALLIPLKLKDNFPVQNVQFNLQADPANAKIRGQSLYWKPQSGNNAEYQFKVIVSTPGGQSSSTSFTVDVRPFNTPPRFTPMRTISIPVGRPFNLPIKAVDTDGTNNSLVRYIGVNLPEGATIDQQTGTFEWTPTKQQVGENSFRVIATDQYGAASSANVTMRVIETNSGQN